MIVGAMISLSWNQMRRREWLLGLWSEQTRHSHDRIEVLPAACDAARAPRQLSFRTFACETAAAVVVAVQLVNAHPTQYDPSMSNSKFQRSGMKSHAGSQETIFPETLGIALISLMKAIPKVSAKTISWLPGPSGPDVSPL